MTAAPGISDDLCVMTSSRGEGPFYLASPFRQDIREDRKGKRLDLDIQLVKYPECTPIENAVIEIWSSDVDGTYSGYPEVGHNPWKFMRLLNFGKLKHVEPTNEAQFLRGAQITDADGNVSFTTIVPGWYEPRIPHIHFKVLVNEQEMVVGEFNFQQEFCDQLFTSHETYKKYGKSPYNFQNDKTLEGITEGHGMVLNPKVKDAETVWASAKIGVA